MKNKFCLLNYSWIMYLTWAGFYISKGNYHSVFRGRGQDGKGNKDKIHWGQLNKWGYQRSDLRTGIIYVLLVFRCFESHWEREEFDLYKKAELGPVDVFQMTRPFFQLDLA